MMNMLTIKTAMQVDPLVVIVAKALPS